MSEVMLMKEEIDIEDYLIANTLSKNELYIEKGLNVNDFAKICRTCLAKTGNDLSPIFDIRIGENAKPAVDYLLRECAAIEVDQTDSLPQNVCQNCLKRLTKIHSFRQQCSLSECLLKALLLEAQKKPARSTNVPDLKLENLHSDIDHVYHEDNNHLVDKLADVASTDQAEADDQAKKSQINQMFEKCDNLKQENADENRTKQYDGAKVKKSRTKQTQKKGHTCGACSMTFPTKEEYFKHRRTPEHKAAIGIVCPVCNKIFGMKNRLDMHMRSHTKERPYQCEVCKKTFSKKENLTVHMRTHTGEKPYTCDLCGKCFTESTHLHSHRKIHEKQQSKGKDGLGSKQLFKFTCTFCKRGFKRKRFYDLHLKMHYAEGVEDANIPQENSEEIPEEKPYTCNICNRSFKSNWQLKGHLRSHAGVRNFLCPLCGNKFSSNSTLRTHMNLHTGERPFSCSVCTKCFTQRSSLDCHMRTHYGTLKPHACAICGRRFHKMSLLRYHERVHKGIHPYSCSHCSKTFTLKATMKIHERTHTGEKPYLCAVCGKGFYDSARRVKHQKTHHTEQSNAK